MHSHSCAEAPSPPTTTKLKEKPQFSPKGVHTTYDSRGEENPSAIHEYQALQVQQGVQEQQ